LSQLTQIPDWLYEPVVGDNIALMMNRLLKEREALERIPAYLFDIVLHDGTRVGQIDLRLGSTRNLRMYAGQIGYGIDRSHRGHGFAAQACQLLKPIAKNLGFTEIWITCNPDNYPSVRTCENIGAKYISRVNVPHDCELWHRGDREKLRYLWHL
jgi:predicted acetyltransferase